MRRHTLKFPNRRSLMILLPILGYDGNHCRAIRLHIAVSEPENRVQLLNVILCSELVSH